MSAENPVLRLEPGTIPLIQGKKNINILGWTGILDTGRGFSRIERNGWNSAGGRSRRDLIRLRCPEIIY